MLPGDSFVEPLSGKPVQLQGASRREGQTLPHMGGSQAVLHTNVLVAQRQVIAVLQQCQGSPESDIQRPLEAAIKDMRQALALSLHHILQQARRLERQLAAADDTEASGGRIGMDKSGPEALRPQYLRPRITWCFDAPRLISSGTGLQPHWPCTCMTRGREKELHDFMP